MSWIETPESSNISRFKYARDIGVLTVEFQHGGRYEYFDVPEHIYDGMVAATSRGQFLAQNIKGHYRYARL